MWRPGSRVGVPLLALALLPLGEGHAAAGPVSSSATRAKAYHLYSLAQQSLLQRDYATAVDLLENAAARDAAPDLLVELARLHFALNNTTRSLELARRAVTLEPGLASAHRLLGDVAMTRARDGVETAVNVSRAIRSYRAAWRADPQDEDSGRLLAELLFRSGRLQAAADVLDPLLETHPRDPALALLRAKVHLETGALEEAQALLEHAVADPRESVDAADTLGSLYELRSDYTAAIALYQPLIEKHPKSAYLHYRLGSMFLLAGRYQEALRALRESHRLEVDNGRVWLPMARALEGAGDTTAALAAYDSLIERDRMNLEARFHRARLLVNTGERQTALKEFRSIINLADGPAADAEARGQILGLSYVQTGLIEMSSRRHDRAVDAFRGALALSRNPGPELYLLLGQATLLAEGPLATEKVVSEAMGRFPDDVDLRILEGEVLIARGERARARLVYQDVLVREQSSARGYVAVSEALLRQEWYEEADALLEEGTRRHPMDDRLYFTRGAAMERLGRIGDAESLLVKAIGINPENATALNYLGYMLADHDMKLEDSLGYVERALALDPGNPAYLDSLGWAQFKLARYDSAEASIRAALRYDEFDPTIREHLGDLLMATGRTEEALREWQAALGHGHEQPDRILLKVEKARSGLRDLQQNRPGFSRP